MTEQERIEAQAQDWADHAINVIAEMAGSEVAEEIINNPDARAKMIEAAATIAWGIEHKAKARTLPAPYSPNRAMALDRWLSECGR